MCDNGLPLMFTREERRALIAIARASIRSAITHTTGPPADAGLPGLQQPAGAFVTVRVGGHLRGCVGYVRADRPLCDVIGEVAGTAATGDHRFRPVGASELRDTTIEISVLSPLMPVEGPGHVTVGTHGVVIERGDHRGLLLPQVATEYGWDREQFLSAVSQKAGLPADAWQESESQLFVFTAEILLEGDG